VSVKHQCHDNTGTRAAQDSMEAKKKQYRHTKEVISARERINNSIEKQRNSIREEATPSENNLGIGIRLNIKRVRN